MEFLDFSKMPSLFQGSIWGTLAVALIYLYKILRDSNRADVGQKLTADESQAARMLGEIQRCGAERDGYKKERDEWQGKYLEECKAHLETIEAHTAFVAAQEKVHAKAIGEWKQTLSSYYELQRIMKERNITMLQLLEHYAQGKTG